jgi:1,4-alpha-glucan branching enzyme
VPRLGYRIGAPVRGRWTEILNSDASDYGGSGVGNFGAAETIDEPTHGRQWSLSLTLPPLGVVAFRAPVQPVNPDASLSNSLVTAEQEQAP